MSVVEKAYSGFIECVSEGKTTLAVKKLPSRVEGKPSTLCNIHELVNGVPKDIYFLVLDRTKGRDIHLANSGTTAGQNWTVNEKTVIEGMPGVPDATDGSDAASQLHQVMKILFEAVKKEYGLGKHFELRYTVTTKEGEELAFFELPSNTFKGEQRKKAYSFQDHLARPGWMTFRVKYAIINYADSSDPKGEKNRDYVFFRFQLGIANFDPNAPATSLRKRKAVPASDDAATASKLPTTEKTA